MSSKIQRNSRVSNLGKEPSVEGNVELISGNWSPLVSKNLRGSVNKSESSFDLMPHETQSYYRKKYSIDDDKFSLSGVNEYSMELSDLPSV